MILLETNRLLFRSHEARDENDFVKMHTDPEVRRYVGGQAWPLEKAVHRFRRQYLGRPAKTYGLWATILKEEDRYIGCCGLRALGNRTASLGYYIARPYWRRGLATEASQAFLELGYTRLRLERIRADITKGHAASERVLQKFNFRYVSQEELGGGERIICSYELLKADWERNNDQARHPA